jgi:hypothetical protein
MTDDAWRSDRFASWDRERLSRVVEEAGRAAAEAEVVQRDSERLQRVAAAAIARRHRQYRASVAAAAPYAPSALRLRPLAPRPAASQCRVSASQCDAGTSEAPAVLIAPSTHTTVPGGSTLWPVVVDVRSLAAPAVSSPSRPELAVGLEAAAAAVVTSTHTTVPVILDVRSLAAPAVSSPSSSSPSRPELAVGLEAAAVVTVKEEEGE